MTGITAPRPAMRWPDDALICMSVTVAFEAFKYASHVSHTTRKPGKADVFSLSYGDYGPKVGVWRVFDMLDRYGLTCTFDIGGMAAERHPAIISEMAQRGHETAGHGYANDVYPDPDDPETERRDIKATIAAIQDATGERPVGWVSPGSVGTEKTFDFMIEEGFLWNGDDASDDIPFVRQVNGSPLVIVPRINHPTNDLTAWIMPRNSPLAYWDGFKETFDFLYDEGRRGGPKWVDVLLHCDMGARPALMSVFERTLQYAKGHERVWFARRRDIAQWVLERFGAEVVSHDKMRRNRA